MIPEILLHIAEREPVLVMMIGMPASGKTSLRNAIVARFGDRFVVINGDDIRHRIAQDQGIAYSQTFTEDMNAQVDREIESAYATALTDGKSVLWDQMNIDKAERVARVLAAEKQGYESVGVYFPVTLETCKARVLHREMREGGIPIREEVLDGLWAVLQQNLPADDEFGALYSLASGNAAPAQPVSRKKQDGFSP